MRVQVIPIPTEVVSHSLPFHSQFCVLLPFPWDSHGIPGPIGNPIPMHISIRRHCITVIMTVHSAGEVHSVDDLLPYEVYVYTEGCTVASAYTLRSRCDPCVTSRHLSHIHHSPKHANWPPPARRTDRENFDPLYAAVPACVPVKDRSMTSVRYFFIARRCALARSLLSPGVCLSVCHVGALYPHG